jgi:hypothetical protein
MPLLAAIGQNYQKSGFSKKAFPIGSGDKKILEMIFLALVYAPTSNLGVA